MNLSIQQSVVILCCFIPYGVNCSVFEDDLYLVQPNLTKSKAVTTGKFSNVSLLCTTKWGNSVLVYAKARWVSCVWRYPKSYLTEPQAVSTGLDSENSPVFPFSP